jgi:hypothetical protein
MKKFFLKKNPLSRRNQNIRQANRVMENAEVNQSPKPPIKPKRAK